ncbi:hypothetical protein YH65_04000 [Sulfurovum lithotrophicum]|uniref:Flagellar motor switch protein FliN-like C-terminal domain-containing protein n=1 Tax=Sulfurovum lithotrophicum TaxID=206403 RepID=A0A7U4RQD5_9BACT|nr:FliM/FliN family flagellar motor switch protein [Sulfurovum lithotrophicum]AKF24641.1 hypothetical protein YH65_04000 [Sulfurovum lithotrophicum]
MKDENQALRLERLMQKHQVYPEYELCLPSVTLKKSLLKKLSKGDVLLLGMQQMEMILVSEENGCAKAVLVSYDESMTIQIVEPVKYIVNKIDNKKYKEVEISLATLRSRVLEAGHKVETTQVDMDDISLFVEKKKIATARLVMVDDEIAVQIKEVKKI